MGTLVERFSCQTLILGLRPKRLRFAGQVCAAQAKQTGFFMYEDEVVEISPSARGHERPGPVLEGPAALTWQAYNAMQATKSRHFELLQVLDAKKKKFNIDPTSDDKTRLAHLLADHDAQVKRFTIASAALKAADTDAHQALFEYIGYINSGAAGDVKTH